MGLPPVDTSVVVLGATGFIGNALTQYLRRCGCYVLAPSSSECNLLDLEVLSDYFDNLREEVRVVFCAAITREREDSPEAMLKNIQMVANFNRTMPDSSVKSLIYLSSVDVYGRPAELPITEDTSLAPVNYYGIAKLSSEYILRTSVDVGVPRTILRLPGIYGPGDGRRSIIGKLLVQLVQHGRVQIDGDGSALRDYVKVRDLCRLIRHFLSFPHNGVLNVATEQSISIRDLVATLGEATGVSYQINFISECTNPQQDLVFQTECLRRAVPEFRFSGIVQGISDYIEQSGWEVDG